MGVVYIIIVLQEYKKTITNLYLVQLAVSDLLFMCFLPFEAHAYVHGTTSHYGTPFCKMYQTVRFMSYYSSIFFLTVMSLDRYLAINHAMKSWAMKLRRKRAVYCVSALVWILCFACVLPILIRSKVLGCKCSNDFRDTREEGDYDDMDYSIGYGSGSGSGFGSGSGSGSGFGSGSGSGYVGNDTGLANSSATSWSLGGSGSVSKDDDFDEAEFISVFGVGEAGIDAYFTKQGILLCSYDGSSNGKMVLWNFTGAFLVQLLIIVACYISILIRLSKPLSNGTKSSNSVNARKRVTKMVVLLVTSFIVCWMPYHIFSLGKINGYDLSVEGCKNAQEIVSLIAFGNSVLDPILYTFLGTNIRKRWTETMARTRSSRLPFGSRSEDNRGKTTQRNRSHTGGGDSVTSFTTKNTKVQQTVIMTKVENDRL